jgi:hypothetical protein
MERPGVCKNSGEHRLQKTHRLDDGKLVETVISIDELGPHALTSVKMRWLLARTRSRRK